LQAIAKRTKSKMYGGVLGAGCWVLGAGCWILGIGFVFFI